MEVDLEVVVEEDRAEGQGCGSPLQVIRFQDPVLILVADRQAVRELFKATADADVVIGTQGSLKDLVLPIGIRRPEHSDLIGCPKFIDHGAELPRGEDGLLLDELGHGIIAVKVKFERTAPTLFCGNDDDPAGGPGSVDGCRGGIFEDGERLDIVWIDEAERVACAGDDAGLAWLYVVIEGYPIDHDEGVIAGAEGRAAADADRAAGPGLAAVGNDRHPGYLTRDHLFRGGDGAFLEVFFTDDGNGAGEVFFAGGTIADDDNLIEAGGAGGQ